jgi:multidrug efflux system outer membrane protein
MSSTSRTADNCLRGATLRGCLPKLIWVAGVFISGCTVGPNYKRPDICLQDSWEGPPSTQFSTVEQTPPPLAWWATLNDPVLDSLVKRAWHGNLDVSIAKARIREARALRAVAAAGEYPEVNGAGSYGFYHRDGPLAPVSSSDYQHFYSGFDAVWEADVFGGVRRSIEAAQDDLEARTDAARGVLVSTVGEVARNYVELRTAQCRAAIATENVQTEQETLDLARRLLTAGVGSELDVSQAHAQLTTTKAALPAFDIQAKIAIHQLGVLLGESPDALAAELNPLGAIPISPRRVPIGLPSDLLRRRPDVRQVERELASATAQIGVAEADLFPQFTLTGDFGFSATNASNFFSWTNRSVGVGPAVRWQLLDGGRILANVEAHKAVRQELIDQYKLTILIAMREVADALISFQREQDQYDLLRQSVNASQTSVRIATERYADGTTGFLSVLDAERSLLQTQDALAVSRGDITLSMIGLYKAVGGGWEEIEKEGNSDFVAGK